MIDQRNRTLTQVASLHTKLGYGMLITLTRWANTELCLNLYLSRDLLQADNIWPSVQVLLQPTKAHFVSTCFPHRHRLSVVVNMLARIAHAITTLGTLYM